MTVSMKTILTKILNRLSYIGEIRDSYLAADKSVPHNSSTALCSVTLDKGTWLIVAGFRCDSNSSGARRANVTNKSGDTAVHYQIAPVSGGLTQGNFSIIARPTTSTLYYLNVFQYSGAALTYKASGAGYGNYIRAMRIA